MESRVRVSHRAITAGLGTEVALLVEVEGTAQALLEVVAPDGGRVERIGGIETTVSERGIGTAGRQVALRAEGTEARTRALAVITLSPSSVLGSRRIAEVTTIAIGDDGARRSHTEVVTIGTVPASRLPDRNEDPEVVLEWRLSMVSALLEEARLRRDAYDVTGARSVVRDLLEALDHPILRGTSDPRIVSLREATTDLGASLEHRSSPGEGGQEPGDRSRGPRRRRRT